MRHILSSSLIALSFIAAAPAMAGSSSFESTVAAPLSSSVKIEVVLGEDLAHRANNLPEKLRDRRHSRNLNAGFANNGYYGDRDLQRLTKRLQSKLEASLVKKGLNISETAPTVLRVTLVDAKPNRPTFKQLGREAGLSIRSFGIGGAKMESELIAAGGQSLGTINYKWYENDIRDAQYGGTWTDANRAIDRFAKKTAKSLQSTPS